MKIIQSRNAKNQLPRLIDALNFNHLAEILRIQSNVYPTNDIDLLLLGNKSSMLSEILGLFQNYKAKNNDFKTVTRIMVHIRPSKDMIVGFSKSLQERKIQL
jgi:hypothetical protein